MVRSKGRGVCIENFKQRHTNEAERRKLAMSTADVAYNTVKAIYRNPYKEVTTTTLNKLAAALGVPTSELIEDVPEE
jgi:DNA-binding Xre family transcriptional regulator